MKVLGVGLILSLAALAQPLQLEVASIRLNPSGSERDSGINISSGGRISGTNLSLKTLVWQAWGTVDFRLAGGPPWLDTDRYDIEARTENGVNIESEQLQPLLQRLLADRFALKAHWETRETTVYVLQVDKNGHRLKENTTAPSPRLYNTAFNRHQVSGKARITATGAPMASLAVSLTNVLGREVLDKTGLTSAYDFTLDWEMDPGAQDATGASLFTALREQLGLRLESQKGQVEMLVIDHAEKASEN